MNSRFNAGSYAEEIILNARDRYLYPERKADLVVAAIPKILEIITVTSAGIFLIGGYLLNQAEAYSAVPALFVYILILFRLRPVLKVFNDYRLKIARVRPRLKIVSQIVSEPDERSVGSRKTGRVGLVEKPIFEKEIKFKEVSFRFPGESKTVLRDINLTIPKGASVALVGPSGAGKSSILDILLGLYSPSKGPILVDDVDLSSIDIQKWRESLGVVDQEVFLLNMSVYDNIRFGRPAKDYHRIEHAAKAALAHEFIMQMPEGYNTVIGERFQTFWGAPAEIGASQSNIWASRDLGVGRSHQCFGYGVGAAYSGGS